MELSRFENERRYLPGAGTHNLASPKSLVDRRDHSRLRLQPDEQHSPAGCRACSQKKAGEEIDPRHALLCLLCPWGRAVRIHRPTLCCADRAFRGSGYGLSFDSSCVPNFWHDYVGFCVEILARSRCLRSRYSRSSRRVGCGLAGIDLCCGRFASARACADSSL